MSIPDIVPLSYFSKIEGVDHDLINYMKRYNNMFFFKFQEANWRIQAPYSDC